MLNFLPSLCPIILYTQNLGVPSLLLAIKTAHEEFVDDYFVRQYFPLFFDVLDYILDDSHMPCLVLKEINRSHLGFLYCST